MIDPYLALAAMFVWSDAWLLGRIANAADAATRELRRLREIEEAKQP